MSLPKLDFDVAGKVDVKHKIQKLLSFCGDEQMTKPSYYKSQRPKQTNAVSEHRARDTPIKDMFVAYFYLAVISPLPINVRHKLLLKISWHKRRVTNLPSCFPAINWLRKRAMPNL